MHLIKPLCHKRGATWRCKHEELGSFVLSQHGSDMVRCGRAMRERSNVVLCCSRRKDRKAYHVWIILSLLVIRTQTPCMQRNLSSTFGNDFPDLSPQKNQCIKLLWHCQWVRVISPLPMKPQWVWQIDEANFWAKVKWNCCKLSLVVTANCSMKHQNVLKLIFFIKQEITLIALQCALLLSSFANNSQRAFGTFLLVPLVWVVGPWAGWASFQTVIGSWGFCLSTNGCELWRCSALGKVLCPCNFLQEEVGFPFTDVCIMIFCCCVTGVASGGQSEVQSSLCLLVN